MINNTVTIGTKEYALDKREDGKSIFVTDIDIPLKSLFALINAQASLTTLNRAMHILDNFETVYPQYTKSTEILKGTFDIPASGLSDTIRSKYDEIIDGEGYTMDDVMDAGLMIGISYETQKIIFAKEDETDGVE